VSQVFARSEKLEGQIHEIKLRIPEWKVLFIVDGNMTSDQMAEFLGVSEEELDETLNKLKDMQLISEFGEKPAEVEDKEDKSDIELTQSLAEEEEVSLEEKSDDEEQEGKQEGLIEDRIELSREEEKETKEEAKEENREDEEDFFSIMGDTDETTEVTAESTEAEEEKDLSGFEEMDEETLSESLADKESDSGEEEKDETLSDQEFDKFIGGLLNEEEEKKSTSLESDDDILEAETPLEVEEDKGESDLDFGDFLSEEMPESGVEVEEEKQELVEEEKIEEKIPEAPAVQETPGKGKTILVVDDSVVIRKMVEIALENEQFNIMSVATGKDALKYLDENDPDLIILDIMLPDVNGLDVLKAVKASKQQIPVVMLSAKDTPRETSKAKELGANDFIPKPFKDEELVSKINELVGN
jgi:CheY-like chemotaxis protein